MKKINLKNFKWILFGIFICSGIYFRVLALDCARIWSREWVARDFDRAFNIIDGTYIPLAGPESNAGGRLPGPFMYFFLAIPLLLDYSYESIFIFNFALNLASMGGLFFVLRRYFDDLFSIIAVSLISISVHQVSAVNLPINPAFLFPFIVLFIYFLFEFLLKRNSSFLPWIVFIFSLGIQFHYSIAAFFLVAFFSPLILG